MGKKKRQTIPAGLTRRTILKDAAALVMDKKLFKLNSAIILYFKDESIVNLHSVRIALRRVRYSMEIFTVCFNKKKYRALYKRLVKLQDVSGAARDLDVFTDNISKLRNEQNIPVSNRIFERVKKNKILLKAELKIELMKFIHGKPLKGFQTSLLSRKLTKA